MLEKAASSHNTKTDRMGQKPLKIETMIAEDSYGGQQSVMANSGKEMSSSSDHGMGIVMGVALGVIGTVVGLGGVALVAFCSGCRLKCGDVFERKHVYATMEDNGAGAITPGHFRKPGPPVILPNEVKSGTYIH